MGPGSRGLSPAPISTGTASSPLSFLSPISHLVCGQLSGICLMLQPAWSFPSVLPPRALNAACEPTCSIFRRPQNSGSCLLAQHTQRLLTSRSAEMLSPSASELAPDSKRSPTKKGCWYRLTPCYRLASGTRPQAGSAPSPTHRGSEELLGQSQDHHPGPWTSSLTGGRWLHHCCLCASRPPFPSTPPLSNLITFSARSDFTRPGYAIPHAGVVLGNLIPTPSSCCL